MGNKSHWISAFRLRYEALWVFIGQFGIAMGVLFGVKILTQVLDPLEFGRLALANTVVLLIGTNLFGPLGQGLMRFWSISQERNQVEEFVFTSNRYAGFLMLIMLGASLVSLSFLPFRRWDDWPVLIAISLIVGALTGYLGLRLSVFLAARKRKIVALVNTGTAFLNPLIALFFVILIVSDADCVMWGYFVAVLIMVCAVEYWYRKTLDHALRSSAPIENPKTESGSLGKEILTFSWPFCVWGIFGWIHQSCDRWSLQAFHGPDVVGAFSVIAVLAVYPLIFGANFLSNLFLPIAYDRAGNLTSSTSIQSANKVLYLMTAAYVIGASILILVFLFFHSEVVLLMSNVNYTEFSSLLPGLTAAWAFFYLGQMFSGFGLLANKPKKYILPIVVSAIVAAITTFYLSKRCGPVGVVWGLGISGFIYALWFMAIGFRLSNSIRVSARHSEDDDGQQNPFILQCGKLP
ncbi:MAG: lipopolysaccharide biosynthesis protein [Deltaproteobacteria bacterium]|nr:lipopolysaccharide biosynthesis protein [Deltaproteobacteria bacterium]